MKLNFYCIMRDYKGPEPKIKSVDKQKVIFVRSQDLYAAVSHTKFKFFENSPQNIRHHEKIIAAVNRYSPVLPFPLNTIVGDTMGKGVLYSHYDEFKAMIKKIGDKKEFLVRAYRDPDNKISRFLKLSRISGTSGIADQRKNTAPGMKIPDLTGHKTAARIHNHFNREALDAHYHRLKDSEQLMEGYYLVSENNIDTFNSTFSWVESLYPEVHFFLEGPQPPYHFNTVSITASNTPLYGNKHG